MRKSIYRMVHIYDGNALSVFYKYFMIVMTILSLVPLAYKQDNYIFKIVEAVCLIIFVIDYILRWSTADYKFDKKGVTPFLKYPIRLISIVDLLSILALVISVFDLLQNVKIAPALAVFRIIRIFRYSKNVRTILGIFMRSKKPLFAVGSLAVGYIIVSAIVMFNAEPESFATFFDAVYWSTVSLTTVGYGDIYPVTNIGRLIAMLSSFFGIAIVALPAGIITAEYLNIIKNEK